MDNNEIGKRISNLREERRWTQEELAVFLNVAINTVTEWENGSISPEKSMYPKIADVFGVKVDELINGVYIGDNNVSDIALLNGKNIYEKLSSEQKKAIKKSMIKDFYKKNKSLGMKIIAALLLIAVITVSSLLGTGVIKIKDVPLKLPSEKDFSVTFFATSSPLQYEYTLGKDKICLSFDSAIKTNNNNSYKVEKPIIKTDEINWYRTTLFHYTYKYNDGLEWNLSGNYTGIDTKVLINDSYNFNNNVYYFSRAGKYTITGYCEFFIGNKKYAFSDSIDIEIYPAIDILQQFAEYGNAPPLEFKGYIPYNAPDFWGDNVALRTNFADITDAEYNNYLSKLKQLGYFNKTVNIDDRSMLLYENEIYKIYLLYNKKIDSLNRYIILK